MLVPEYHTLGGTKYIKNVTSQRTGVLVSENLTLGVTNNINNVTSSENREFLCQTTLILEGQSTLIILLLKRAGTVSDRKPYFVPPKVRFSGTYIARTSYVGRDKNINNVTSPENREC